MANSKVQRPVYERVEAIRHRQPYSIVRAVWLAAISALIISCLIILGATDPVTHRLVPGFHLLFNVGCLLVLFTVLYIFNFWMQRGVLRGFALVAVGLVGSLVITTLFTFLACWIERLAYGTNSFGFTTDLFVNTLSALIAYLIAMLLHNVTQRQRTLLENEHLHNENLSIRSKTLEQQMSPHFLFNSLNTLDGLIGYDNERAHCYVQQLATTYRYVLQQKKVVTLREELDFTHTYIAMMLTRFGDALRVEEHINDSLLEHRLPPISLQMLVENAIKHNVVTQRHPLTISINTTDGRHPSLIVGNPLQPKQDDSPRGMGLVNLNQRYTLLFDREITITKDDRSFTVEIPLI